MWSSGRLQGHLPLAQMARVGVDMHVSTIHLGRTHHPPASPTIRVDNFAFVTCKQ